MRYAVALLMSISRPSPASCRRTPGLGVVNLLRLNCERFWRGRNRTAGSFLHSTGREGRQTVTEGRDISLPILDKGLNEHHTIHTTPLHELHHLPAQFHQFFVSSRLSNSCKYPGRHQISLRVPPTSQPEPEQHTDPASSQMRKRAQQLVVRTVFVRVGGSPVVDSVDDLLRGGEARDGSG